ncbi:MAG: ABC transporter substrate-binding protein, partial [Symbiobacteriaceae bacterium]|nr:ABC transporter substrate-binding protein [Symbiobacteriaceae bacterium]
MKRIISLFLVLAMLLGLAACQTTTPTPTVTAPPTTAPPTDPPKSANYLKIGSMLDSAMNLDPLTSTYNQVFEINDTVFNRLVQPDPVTLELKPYLIVDWPKVNDDGTVFTFELRKGVKFHDGTELTAYDVEYTFTRFFTPKWNNLNTWMADFILGAEDLMEGHTTTLAGFTVIDDYHFSIELEYGYTAFLACLAVPPLAIVPKDACEAAGPGKWGVETFIGTGQYQLKSFNPGVELILERNDNYWGPIAKLDGIQWNHMLPEVALITWEAGDIDICGVDVSLVDGYLTRFPNNVREQTYVGSHWLSFNCDLPPMDNILVREAVGLATNIAELCEDYF